MADALRTLERTIDAWRRGNYSLEDDDRNESEVMGYIHGYYKEAFDRLPCSLDSFVHEAGVCFGFLDPVSNIIANTAVYRGWSSQVEEEANREAQGGRGKKRRRSQAGTSSKAKGKKASSKGEDATQQKGKAICADTNRIAARSRKGLVTFLTTYFRYLTISEALRYLRLAEADLLVAVRLIEEDRDSEAFTIHHPTTEVALTCAALSAMRPHVAGSDDPKVTRLVNSSLMLASRLDEVCPLLAIQGRLSISTLDHLFKLSSQCRLVGTVNSEGVMSLAISRFPTGIKKTPFPFDLELALKKVLQDRIHGFYLKAISCIPASCLRPRHHRGLLKAGHCYGRFDPVTNIILNSIWYDTVFPLQQEFEVGMIYDEALARTECRSLHGLITFVTNLFPALSTYNATRYLLLDNATLDNVILRANRDGYYQTRVDLHDAHKAAALAANHPNPTALANFALGSLQEGLKLKLMLEDKRALSPDDVQTISTSLLQYPHSKPERPVQKLTKGASQIVSGKRKDFEARQSLICKRVQAALSKHPRDKGEEYELLVICGVNDEIPLNGKIGYYENYNGYPYSHVNIWARLKGSQLADVAPTLLFLQFRNDPEDTKDSQSVCLPVSESSKYAGRCFHCERRGTKIVHPFSHTYLGQSFDFEEMARGKHSVTNGGLVRGGGRRTIFLDTSQDDCIYFDPARDADFSARLNKDAKRELEGEDGASARAQIRKVKEVARAMAAFIDLKETSDTEMVAPMGETPDVEMVASGGDTEMVNAMG